MSFLRLSYLFIVPLLATSFITYAPLTAEATEPPPTLWEYSLQYPDLWHGFLEVVEPTPDGGALSAGDAFNSAGSGYDLQAVKLDAAGYEEWVGFYGTEYNDELVGLAATLDGGALLLGSATISGGNLPYDGPVTFAYRNSFLVKVDAFGDEEWRYYFNPAVLERTSGLALAHDGGVLVVGSAYAVMTQKDGSEYAAFMPAVAKVDADGALSWNDIYDSGNYGEGLMAVASAGDGGFLICGGYTAPTYFTFRKLDSTGALTWYTKTERPQTTNITSMLDMGRGVFNIGATYFKTGSPTKAVLMSVNKKGLIDSAIIDEPSTQHVRNVSRLSDGGAIIATERYLRKVDSTGAEEWILIHDDGNEWLFNTYFYQIKETDGGYLGCGGKRFGPWPENSFYGYVLRLGEDSNSTGDFIAVEVDVKPGNKHPEVVVNQGKLLDVAVFGNEDLDTADIDPASIRFAGAELSHRGITGVPHMLFKDLDKDGFGDLVLSFRTEDIDTTSNIFTAKTHSGVNLQGEAEVIWR
ncbi:MAG: hypothetical protein C0608_02845 [Deltaproteobacteria bacterium]|nr:MAG: hypothetical protein C0608_02845 [Deltaproteobacteria bacterium]